MFCLLFYCHINNIFDELILCDWSERIWPVLNVDDVFSGLRSLLWLIRLEKLPSKHCFSFACQSGSSELYPCCMYVCMWVCDSILQVSFPPDGCVSETIGRVESPPCLFHERQIKLLWQSVPHLECRTGGGVVNLLRKMEGICVNC